MRDDPRALMERYANLATKCRKEKERASLSNNPFYHMYEQAEQYCLDRLEEAIQQMGRVVSEV